MRHQNEHRHAAQHRTRRAAQQLFARTRMTGGAHHNEVGAKIRGIEAYQAVATAAEGRIIIEP